MWPKQFIGAGHAGAESVLVQPREYTVPRSEAQRSERYTLQQVITGRHAHEDCPCHPMVDQRLPGPDVCAAHQTLFSSGRSAPETGREPHCAPENGSIARTICISMRPAHNAPDRKSTRLNSSHL